MQGGLQEARQKFPCPISSPALLESRAHVLHDFENILMDSIKTAAESTWNGHPPLSVQASGVWGAQKGTELCGQM